MTHNPGNILSGARVSAHYYIATCRGARNIRFSFISNRYQTHRIRYRYGVHFKYQVTCESFLRLWEFHIRIVARLSTKNIFEVSEVEKLQVV